MGWLRVRFAPAPPPGLTWTTATLTCSWDMAWSDGVQRPPSPQYGVINALGTEFITKGGTQTDYLRVPGTEVGTSQIIGPVVKFEFTGTDSNNNYHSGTWYQQVDATAAGEWDIRRQAAAAITGNNPAGTNPPGVSVGDIGVTVAPYTAFTIANSHNTRHIVGGADPLLRVGDVGGLAVPAAPTIAFQSGQNVTLTPRLTVTTFGATNDQISFSLPFTRVPTVANTWTAYTITPPSGWTVVNAWGGSYNGTLVDALAYIDNFVLFPNSFTGSATSQIYITLRKT